jgi:hypothetical protein
MKRDFQIILDRLYELGCIGYSLSESGFKDVTTIKVCNDNNEVKKIYDTDIVNREDLLKYGYIGEFGSATIKFKDETYELIIPINSNVVNNVKD